MPWPGKQSYSSRVCTSCHRERRRLGRPPTGHGAAVAANHAWPRPASVASAFCPPSAGQVPVILGRVLLPPLGHELLQPPALLELLRGREARGGRSGQVGAGRVASGQAGEGRTQSARNGFEEVRRGGGQRMARPQRARGQAADHWGNAGLPGAPGDGWRVGGLRLPLPIAPAHFVLASSAVDFKLIDKSNATHLVLGQQLQALLLALLQIERSLARLHCLLDEPLAERRRRCAVRRAGAHAGAADSGL